MSYVLNTREAEKEIRCFVILYRSRRYYESKVFHNNEVPYAREKTELLNRPLKNELWK